MIYLSPLPHHIFSGGSFLVSHITCIHCNLLLFSGAKSKNLQANTAACLSSLAKDHRENQDLIVAKGAVRALVALAKSTKTLCQVKAASALQSLATNNPEAQKEIDAADAQRPLIRLLKMWAIEVKEQGW